MKTGIELIAEERQEQIEKHGRTIEKDISLNQDFELTEAASVLISLKWDNGFEEADLELMPENWNQDICRKMMLKNYKDRLIIAGALIAAEIDRIQNI